MEKDERRKKNGNSNKRLISAFTLIVAFITITLCLLSVIAVLQPAPVYTSTYSFYSSSSYDIVPVGDPITWDVRMNFSETSGKIDSAYFGEVPDANDGPPVDSHDILKPPSPPTPPYLRAWFNDKLPVPYNTLWKDYRHYPGTSKIWNLSVQWVPTDYVSPTIVTISWSTMNVNLSEYDKVVLCNKTGVVLVPNMFTTGSYTFSCSAMVLQSFKINCTVDTKPPQIINHSLGTGETGDTFTFNASVFDDMTPSSSLLVKVNWVHGSLSGNDTMTYVSGNYFVKQIELSNYSTNLLTYHFYVKDTAKVPNINYTSQYSATVTDDEAPNILGNSVSLSVGTGDSIVLWAQASDNIAVTSAKVTIDAVDHVMTFNSGNSHWEYTYTAPTGSTTSHSYSVMVYDAAANSKMNGPYTITVSDNDAPTIIVDSGSQGVGTGDSIVLWVQASDNIAVTSAKVTIDAVDHVMTFNSGNSHWEYTYTAPTGSTTSHSYTVMVYDAAANSKMNGLYTITVSDNDAPSITNVHATPSSQLINGHINITATITDNINLLEQKVRITGPAGYTPVNISMTPFGGNTFYYDSPYTITGIYTYSIWAKDTNNNGVASTTYQFDIFAELNITNLLIGWNFVSLPFNQTITKTNLIVIYEETEYSWAEAVAAGHVIDTIFKWNRSSPQVYWPASTLAPGYGYWFYAYHTCEIWATDLNPMVSTNFITNLSVQWNIFGVPVNQPVSKTSLIVNYLGIDYTWTQATTTQNPTGGPIVVKDLFDWNRNSPQGYLLSDILNAGYCYWIYSYYTCILKRTL